jgi:hypothetical protein
VEIFTKGLYYPQWQACVEGILCKTFKPSEGPQTSRGDGSQKAKEIAKARKSSHVGPKEGCCDISALGCSQWLLGGKIALPNPKINFNVFIFFKFTLHLAKRGDVTASNCMKGSTQWQCERGD